MRHVEKHEANLGHCGGFYEGHRSESFCGG